MTPLKVLAEHGPHERRISRMYGGRMLYDGSTPEFDFPLLIIAFTNRSGSSLLGELLRQTGRCTGFGEPLNADQAKLLADTYGLSSFPDQIRHLAGRGGTPDKVCGIKASADQLAMLLRCNIPAMFSSAAIAHIERRDVVKQAVSHWIAHQTQKWRSGDGGNGAEAVFDAKAIDGIIDAQAKVNGSIRHLIAVSGLPSAHVYYEPLVREPKSTVRRVGAVVGEDFADWTPKPTRLKRQADDRNAEFVELYLKEAGKALGR